MILGTLPIWFLGRSAVLLHASVDTDVPLVGSILGFVQHGAKAPHVDVCVDHVDQGFGRDILRCLGQLFDDLQRSNLDGIVPDAEVEHVDWCTAHRSVASNDGVLDLHVLVAKRKSISAEATLDVLNERTETLELEHLRGVEQQLVDGADLGLRGDNCERTCGVRIQLLKAGQCDVHWCLTCRMDVTGLLRVKHA